MPAFLLPAPPAVRLALGAAVALSPVLVRAAWFGQADAPSLLCLVLAFALLARSRLLWAAGFLAGAVLLKQFALVAVPFFAVMLLQRRVNRTALTWSAVVFAAVLAAGFLPFLLADARAVWEDTIRYEPGRTGSSATAFGDPPQPRRHRRPLRAVPLRLAGGARLGRCQRSTCSGSSAGATSWGRRGRIRGLDLHAALHRARLPDVVPGLAAGRGRARGCTGCFLAPAGLSA